MDFYLGTDVAGLRWGVPVMVSHGRLRSRKTVPRATAPWILDSRGFTELSQHGRWTITAADYADAIRFYAREIGQLQWASPQDWMCEPVIINGGTLPNGQVVPGTHLSVAEHQRRTVESVLELRAMVPHVRIIPVLQGYTLDEYLACITVYQAAGLDLWAEPVIGLGSVCRRQATDEIHTIVSVLAAMGLKLHGFGVKTAAIEAVGSLLASADSEAWSLGARRRIVHCAHGLVKWAANCQMCALNWREAVVSGLGSVQLAFPLFEGAAA